MVACIGDRPTHVLPNISIRDEELGAEIVVSDGLVVDDGQGLDASKDEVLGDFVGQGFDGDQKDVCRAQSGRVSGTCTQTWLADSPLLSLDAPKSDLSVVEGNLVCRRGQ